MKIQMRLPCPISPKLGNLIKNALDWVIGAVMLVVMKAQATPEEVRAVCEYIEKLGFRAHPLPGAQRTAIGITGNQGEVERGNPRRAFRCRRSHSAFQSPTKLASRDVKEEDTIIRFAEPTAASVAATWRLSPDLLD